MCTGRRTEGSRYVLFSFKQKVGVANFFCGRRYLHLGIPVTPLPSTSSLSPPDHSRALCLTRPSSLALRLRSTLPRRHGLAGPPHNHSRTTPNAPAFPSSLDCSPPPCGSTAISCACQRRLCHPLRRARSRRVLNRGTTLRCSIRPRGGGGRRCCLEDLGRDHIHHARDRRRCTDRCRGRVRLQDRKNRCLRRRRARTSSWSQSQNRLMICSMSRSTRCRWISRDSCMRTAQHLLSQLGGRRRRSRITGRDLYPAFLVWICIIILLSHCTVSISYRILFLYKCRLSGILAMTDRRSNGHEYHLGETSSMLHPNKRPFVRLQDLPMAFLLLLSLPLLSLAVQFKNLVTFGDSYTDIVNVGDGGTAWPVYAASQLPSYFAEKHSGSINVNAEETLYTQWIGTNDVGVYSLLTGSNGASIVDVVQCMVDWVRVLYKDGARNFLVQNMVPLNEVILSWC
ncbi:hypothetical protein DFS33DRAFT_376718 [Desarmillaria ectypa]|nr:hypothetical protein DFS33DRAFT_376718 [Desarmillaria ectypa]